MYFGIFALGMKDKWKGLNYIEIGSGPGRCVDRTTRIEMDGSSIAILLHPSFGFIRRAIFIDNNPDVVDCLNQRIRSLGREPIAVSIKGNYEIEAEMIGALSQVNKESLNLVFIDPTHCNVPFNSIRAVIEKLGNADLIINVALGTDVARNLRNAITDTAFRTAKEKYERFLDNKTILNQPEVIEQARRCSDRDLRKLFLDTYINTFSKLGYAYSDYRWIEHFYCLLFLSRSEQGLIFWKKASKIDPNNQRELFN